MFSPNGLVHEACEAIGRSMAYAPCWWQGFLLNEYGFVGLSAKFNQQFNRCS